MSNAGPPRVFHLLHLAHGALFRAIDRRLREAEGIATAHQVILFTLVAEDGLSSSEVAERAGHSRSRLTGLVDTLEAKGLVERRASADDGRVNLLHVTPEGRGLIARTMAEAKGLNAMLLAPFDPAEQETISRFLQHVLETSETL
ncbi:MAG: MarR family winged helix-turn-helix transcriptional regulator [Pseudomonadota bacterium]